MSVDAMTVRGSCTAAVRLIAALSGARDSDWSRRFAQSGRAHSLGADGDRRRLSEALVVAPEEGLSEVLLDAAGRRRSPATMPGFHAGRPPRNKKHRYRADPPTVEEIVAVLRAARDGRHACAAR